MNARIQELAKQCQMFNQIKRISWFDHDKFARLIVQECVTVVVDAVDHREPASTYASKIQQHFGVE